MLGLLSTLYLCICVFYIWYTGMSYLISLNPMLFKNIAHVGSFKHFVFVYLRICIFEYFTFYTLKYHVWYPWILCLFKNIAHVWSFKHFVFVYLGIFVYLCICVFMYLCIYVFVYLHLIHGNVIFDINMLGLLSIFVFLFLHIFVFVYLCISHLIHMNVIFDPLESHDFQKSSTCWVF